MVSGQRRFKKASVYLSIISSLFSINFILLTFASPAHAVTIDVTNNSDSGAGCSVMSVNRHHRF